ncbi:MAG: endonuclease MutS2 [Gemmatimonadota bacterium]|nr:MAG: endonuclease MutS2 [Gemmatimonadota bacterium]
MNRHSLRVLEFQRVRDALVDRTTFGGGARAAAAIEPSGDADKIACRLALVSECRRILDDSDLPIHGLADLSAVLAEAEPTGAVLPGVRLAPVSKSLHVVQRLNRFLHERRETAPRLQERARGLDPRAELREELDRSVNADGEVLDGASPALRRIRRQQEQTREKVRGALQKIVRSLTAAGGEPVVTLRNDRYVIGVRRDRVGALGGVVHGQSGSGQSVYLEPNAAVPLNNELAELHSAEDEEILRILTRLTEFVRESLPALLLNEQILIDLDLLYASGKLSRDLNAIPALPSEKGGVICKLGRHPLLEIASRETGSPVVPLDLEIGGDRASTIVITGPNTGGKTVALKTVGLLALMNQSGLHVPTGEGTQLPVFQDVFADIGDEQSIEASLSTFSSHMANVNEMLRQANAHTLVLLDELGVGTDPEEGAAIGKAILAELTRLGARTIVTTHYGALKVFAHDDPGMENASLEFNRESLAPTYRFLQGVPGSSEAISIAQRLGFPAHLVEEARDHLGGEKEAVESLLHDLQSRRRMLDEQRAELERERTQAQALAEKAEERLGRMDEQREKMRLEALEEARQLVQKSKTELSELLGAVRSDGTGGKAAGRARTRLGELGNEFDRELATRAPAPPRRPATAEEVHEGTPILIPGMGWKGTALGEVQSNGKVAVSVGSLRVEVPLSSVELRGADAPPLRRRSASVVRPDVEVSTEIDLRGRTVEEATEEVDRMLDNLLLSGGTWVRIIHGKGTGALRGAITTLLQDDVRIRAFRAGEPAEGGSGVTIAHLQ